MKKSKLFNLDLRDLLKGALLSAITSIATALLTILNNGDIMTLLLWETLKPILIVGLTTFISYLLKNFLTNEDDLILKKEAWKN